MALEQDLELMDDYLSNRMDSTEKAAFEERLKNEPSLSEECKLQQSLVQGIRQARIAELKSMLNSIPVTSLPTTHTALLTKIGGWVAITGLVATATYFYINRNESESARPEPVEQVTTTEQPVQESDAEPAMQPEESPAEEKMASRPVEKRSPKVTEPETKPAVHVYDPTTEEAESVQKYEQDQLKLISNAFVTSSMEVETHHADKTYNFHYVFTGDKLVLYGAFEKHLYEILEFINEAEGTKTVVLYYQSNYYLLDVSKSTPTVLVPIKNRELLKKLKAHRGH